MRKPKLFTALSRLSLSIGTKLTITVGIGVVLVAGMMVNQQLDNAAVTRQSELERNEQVATADLLRAGMALQRMQIDTREIRLAISEREADEALARTRESMGNAVGYLQAPVQLCAQVENCEPIEKLVSLSKAYAAAAAEMEAIKNDYGDIAKPLEQVNKIGKEIDALIAKATSIATAHASQRMAVEASRRTVAAQISIGFASFAIVILVGAAIFGVLSIGRPIKRIAGILVELTNDRIVDVPYTTRGDEVGDIAKATGVFRASIAEKVINLRVRSALDVVSSNVMLADDQYNIMYANSTLQEMLKEAEGELRKVLSDFDATRIVGANMDIFHEDPVRVRKLLDSLTGSHRSHIAIGSQRFRLVATAVSDQHGKRIGTVVEWKNETVEKSIEAEIDAIVNTAVRGDFSQRIPIAGKRDFLLTLAKAVNALCDNTGKALDDLAAMMGALADGDLTKRITADYQGMFGKLKTDANTMAERIGSTIAEIKASAREVTNASAEISTSTADLSQRTEEQAASLEETSASMEQISATVKKNAENAQAANQSASGTREVADRGGKVVAQAVEAVGKIEESSRKISDIIGVIDEIARQTNLLALNAAVEAARAGDAGRGFAVVASEVRSLAQRSSQAAKDIKHLIINSNGQVKNGVELVNRAGTALAEIVESIKKVARIVSDIASASAEQAAGIEQVNKALTQMDDVTQQNSALVEENAATAKMLEHQSKAMDERVTFLKVDENESSLRRDAPAKAVPETKLAAAAKSAPTAQRGPVARMQATIATAFKQEPEWQEF